MCARLCLYETHFISMRLTLPVASTTKKASLNSGGRMLLAKASKLDRTASLNNTLVNHLTAPRSNPRLTPISEYTVDDGKGGKVHVNVRVITFIVPIKYWQNIVDRATCERGYSRLQFTMRILNTSLQDIGWKHWRQRSYPSLPSLESSISRFFWKWYWVPSAWFELYSVCCSRSSFIWMGF